MTAEREVARTLDAARDVPPLAPVVHDGRRRMGLDVTGLAEASGVHESDLRRIEDGETVPSQVAGAVLAVLGVDASAYLPGSPHGPVPVDPMDEAHGRAITYLRDAARSEPGWLLSPDAGACAVATGWSVEAEARAVALDEVTPHGALRLGRWVTALGVTLLPTWLAVDWETSLMVTHEGAMFAGLVASFLVPFTGVEMMRHARESDGPLHGDVEALGARRARVEALRSVLGAVSDRGLVTYAATRDGLVRREYLATSVTSADVRDEDADHVTVVLRTLVGDVELPWVPRVRDVVDVVTSWGARGARKPSEGPQ